MSFSTWYEEWADQISHIGWGAALTLGLTHHMTPLHAAGVVLAAATLKEGVIDKLTETVALQGSGWQDFLFWCLGIVVGLVALIH